MSMIDGDDRALPHEETSVIPAEAGTQGDLSGLHMLLYQFILSAP